MDLCPLQILVADGGSNLTTPGGISQGYLGKNSRHIPTDFIVLDMGRNEEVPLLLGRPFLNTTNAVLHVGSGHVCFHIQGQTIRCPFNGFDMH